LICSDLPPARPRQFFSTLLIVDSSRAGDTGTARSAIGTGTATPDPDVGPPGSVDGRPRFFAASTGAGARIAQETPDF